MPRLTKIYTRTGDDGTTALGSRERVSKDHLRVQAYGSVDELNAHIGVVLAAGVDRIIAGPLEAIQHELFNLGAELSFPPEEGQEIELPRIEARHIETLEGLIDELNPQLSPLKNFILPGGVEGAALLHVARTVCRRAEREVVALAAVEDVGEFPLAYLNRLSDLLFVFSRYQNQVSEASEPLWDSHR